MKELRCTQCNKLLAKYEGLIEIKCPRCKAMNKDFEDDWKSLYEEAEENSYPRSNY